MYSVFDASPIFFKTKGTVQELAPLIAKHGIGGINPPAELLEDRPAAREAAKCVYDNGLKWGLLPTPVDFYSFSTSDEQFDQGIEKLKVWAETAAIMGVDRSYNHVFPASNERDFDENYEFHLRRVSRVAKVMNENGIRYGLEFVGPKHIRDEMTYPFVYTLGGILSIADAVNTEVGFLFDTYHWFTGSGKMDDLYYAAVHSDRMVCFHINDGIEGRSADEQQDMERMMPMTTGIIDSVTPYRMFLKAGYTGPVLCEPMYPCYARFPKMAPEDVIAELGEAYKRMEALALQ